MDRIQGRWQPSLGVGGGGTSPHGVSGAPASPPGRTHVPASHIAPPVPVSNEGRALRERVAAHGLAAGQPATAQQVRQVAPPLPEKRQ